MNLFNLKDLSIKEVMSILELAEEYANGKQSDFKDKLVANLFFEPSTRTQYSFEAAEHRLHCKVITFNPVGSSIQKGETFYDTLKTFSQYVDCLVVRYSENDYYEGLIGKIDVPILNGGDGSGNHPTQSLLDLLTIKQEFGKFEGLKVAIVGDVANSRVAHTNIEIMKRLGMEVHVSAPSQFQEPGYDWEELDDIVEKMDIIMLLRVQHERHAEEMKMSKQRYHERYGLTMNRVNKMKEKAIIMHPAPFNRNVEIADNVVECSKSRIFKQMKNGMYLRMAVIERAFRGE